MLCERNFKTMFAKEKQILTVYMEIYCLDVKHQNTHSFSSQDTFYRKNKKPKHRLEYYTLYFQLRSRAADVGEQQAI